MQAQQAVARPRFASSVWRKPAYGILAALTRQQHRSDSGEQQDSRDDGVGVPNRHHAGTSHDHQFGRSEQRLPDRLSTRRRQVGRVQTNRSRRCASNARPITPQLW